MNSKRIPAPGAQARIAKRRGNLSVQDFLSKKPFDRRPPNPRAGDSPDALGVHPYYYANGPGIRYVTPAPRLDQLDKRNK